MLSSRTKRHINISQFLVVILISYFKYFNSHKILSYSKNEVGIIHRLCECGEVRLEINKYSISYEQRMY